MNKSGLRQEILSGRLLLGSWIQIAHPTATEILARAGFDWLAVDMEHSEISNETLSAHLRAMGPNGPYAFARVKCNDPMAIRHALDLGVQGIIVPLIHNAEDALAAVNSAKYPLWGSRGFAFTRANNFGVDFDEYAANANASTAVIAMIESRSGLEQVDRILSVEGIDGVLVGLYDLSGSLGIPGQVNDTRVTEAVTQICRAAHEAGKTAGIHQVQPDGDRIQQLIKQGFSLIAVGMDTLFLRDGAAAAYQAALPGNK